MVKLIPLEKGKDLYEEIVKVCKERNINHGVISLIGAVEHARVRYYYQEGDDFIFPEKAGPQEIVSCNGNISLSSNGEIFVHAHIVFSDHEGGSFSGHLATGCKIFVGELAIIQAEGEPPIRVYDKETNLELWDPKTVK